MFCPFLVVHFVVQLVYFGPSVMLLGPSLKSGTLGQSFVCLGVYQFFEGGASMFVRNFGFRCTGGTS